ncbi:tyrosine-type recombinase/integrase [Escherichia coli]|uniref:tyrosine-type recombinase/integrase n=3 Tax=Escherichia coli TaxID=562 RepID=UPI0013021058|nr:tyrosine-type recombinase/integrase [Escherichia coli]EJH1761176.1 tyrosine-type recombinase/integrase [Escherichia coli]KAE9788220.1 tyrosine-type recombinase/integrase [Escherichia coli]MWN30242.1 tyrosine-type recombinase/integrase [Escherichia coli]MWN46221.1 tyrosine-type recombinase/integrase [Escherichia coli]MWN50834.1 tyrosine-type recombinase/integrase [Escherichia coli]
MRKYITNSEWKLFFNAINGTQNEIRDKALLQMAYIHGLRVSELTDLRMGYIDMAEKIIFIRRLKNGLSTNHPLQPESVELLQRWLQIRKIYVKDSQNDYLFLSTHGKKISRQWVHKLCVRYSLRAGLKINVHPHMLRHSCGYALADQGLDTRLIQDYLGHRNIHHTVLYTASNPGRFQRVWQN